MSTPRKKVKKKSMELTLKVNTEELSEQHIRTIRSINSVLTHVLTTQEESEYFDSSSELLRLAACAVKKANFSKKDVGIEYSKQALEFCVDILHEQISNDELIKYDN